LIPCELPRRWRVAAVELAGGVVQARAGSLELASRLREDATDRYERCGLPFEAAESRLVLAEVLRDLGHDKAADRELGQALQVFERLKAAAVPEPGNPSPAGTLSARELEVLRLVAEGLSDHGIAARLVLSPHTVHRHVSNILLKLGETSRAAAVAHAARDSLL
jgi:ATP/maltotriose-dependent transcriptional regulator MalT